MKKILSSVIIISMCLALVSCSGSTGNSSGEDIEIAKPDCADISTETYEDNALTMTVPSGWTVETYGSMGEYSIRCFDPADKSRQIFCYGCLSPILKSKEAKEWYRQYSQATGGGYGSDLFAPAVVLSSGRATDIFKKFETELQKKMVAECDKALISLGDKSKIKFSTLKPDLTPEVMNKIKEDMRKEANETYSYTTGVTFKKTESYSMFSQSKFFKIVRDKIKSKITTIRNDAVRDLKNFVNNTTTQYSNELARNAELKRAEYNEIMKKKITIEELQKEINELKEYKDKLVPMKTAIVKIKGGIDRNVQ